MQRRVLARKYGGAGVSLLLDEYPNSAAAYSLRELSTAFVGQPVVRVRRSDNNAEQDFTATEITDGTLTTFTGANDGFVTTWYDQSGNTKDAVQSTASFQPKLVSNGTLILENGKPVLEMEKARRTGMQIDFTPTVITQPLSLFFLIKKDSHSVSFLYYPLSGLGIAQPSANYISAGVNLLNAFPDTELNKQIIFTNFYNTTNSSAYINSNVTVTGDAGTNNVSNLVLGSGLGYQRSINGFFQELIIYPSDQSTNRTGIETNINNEYNIY